MGFSEKQELLLKPTFHIRKPVEADAAARISLDQHIIHSLRATSDAVAPLSLIRTSFGNIEAPNLIQVVAISGPSATCSNTPLPPVGTRSRLRDRFCRGRSKPAIISKAVDYTIDEEEVTDSKGSITNSAIFQGLLGYVIILPFMEGGRKPMSCFARTCTLCVLSAEESILGTKLWHAVNSALIDEAISRCRERDNGFKQMISSTPFHKDQPALVAFRNLLLEKGFEQVGVQKEIIEKKGILLDRILLQREL